jgi:hypothetical protein
MIVGMNAAALAKDDRFGSPLDPSYALGSTA